MVASALTLKVSGLIPPREDPWGSDSGFPARVWTGFGFCFSCLVFLRFAGASFLDVLLLTLPFVFSVPRLLTMKVSTVSVSLFVFLLVKDPPSSHRPLERVKLLFTVFTSFDRKVPLLRSFAYLGRR